MRTEAEQVAGLCVVAALVPEAVLTVPVGYLDVATLTYGRREIVYASGGYDVWSADGQELLDHDLSAAAAAAALRSD